MLQVQLLLGLISGMVFCIGVGFSTKTWMVFVAMVVGSLRVLVAPSIRSMVGNLVNPNELGKMFAIILVHHSYLLLMISKWIKPYMTVLMTPFKLDQPWL